MNFWLKIYSLAPKSLTIKLNKKIGLTGDQHETKKKTGFLIGYPFFFGLAGVFLLASLLGINDFVLLILTFFGLSIGVFLTIYLMLDAISIARASKLEENLPDALELIATNVSSGLTVENALINSARPEFGELAYFLKEAAKKMFSGKNLEESLLEMVSKIESSVLERSIWLITEGMKKGGTLGNLLIRIATDLRNEAALKKEINSSISMYITLIIIASAFGAPILFGAGTVVSNMLTEQISSVEIDLPAGVTIPVIGNLLSGENSDKIAGETIQIFSLISLLTTSLLASLLIGIIKFNKETAGIRYFPILLILSVSIYIGIIILLGNVLSQGMFF